MKPPYDITPAILKLVSSVSEKLGEVNANYLSKQSPQLRKQNRIKTIQSSLQIEGNSLSEEQMTSLLDNKKVIGPQKDILEVLNAIKVYEHLQSYNPLSTASFLKAHRMLMQGLVSTPGKFRTRGVGIVKGNKVAHMAPPASRVNGLVKELFKYLKSDKDLALIKSCVFHYEIEFIHPFADGNGRMGRLWQTLILMSEYPVFEFLPFETLISKTQKEYYKALAKSDQIGQSTPFIEYMLNVLDQTLATLLDYNNRVLTDHDRLTYFIESAKVPFTRKDYMNVFKDISSATASRDLKAGVERGLLKMEGELNKTVYIINLKKAN